MKRLLTTLYSLLIFLGASSYHAHAQETPMLNRIHWMEGTWTGVGYQEAMKAEWDIELRCKVDEGEFRISYPSISCQGEWQLKNANNYRAEFLEIISEEQDNCGDVVRVVVTRIDDRFMSVAFFLPEIDDVVAAYTVLTRIEQKR
mgnify:CR=1 FL=1